MKPLFVLDGVLAGESRPARGAWIETLPARDRLKFPRPAVRRILRRAERIEQRPADS